MLLVGRIKGAGVINKMEKSKNIAKCAIRRPSHRECYNLNRLMMLEK